MRSYIIGFIDRLSNPPNDIGQLLKNKKSLFSRKGYGTPELEMHFLHKLFLHIQSSHPEFENFSWQQCNEYNDNYYHFQLSSFTVNSRLDVNSDIGFHFEYNEEDKMTSNIYFDSVECPDPEELEYAKRNNIEIGEDGLAEPHWAGYWEYCKKKYQHLEIPCLKFLAVLKLLEINFSMYYLLYTFGNGVEVKFNKEGVTVTEIDKKEIGLGSSSLGEGMNLDEL